MRGDVMTLLLVLGGLGAAAMAQPQPGASVEADTGASKRLGRRYPAPLPPRVPEQREPPEVHVSIVSPQESPVHRRRGMQDSVPAVPGELPAGDQPLEPTAER